MAETPTTDTLNPEPSPDRDTDSDARWMSLREAEALTGVSVRTLRSWYGRGKIDSRLVPGPHGQQREVRADQIEQARGQYTPAPSQTTTEAVLGGRMAGAGLVPVEVFEKIEQAWRQVVEQTARAEVAEAKLEFEQERRRALEQRLAQLEADTPTVTAAAITEPEPPPITTEREPEPITQEAETPEPEAIWPDIDDAEMTRIAADVEELRRSQESRPWWSRLLFGKSR